MKTTALFSLFMFALSYRAEAAIVEISTGVAWEGNVAASTTTKPMNCTGANFLVAIPSFYSDSTVPNAISDSLNNKWTSLTEQTDGGSRHVSIYYSTEATTGSAQTVTVTNFENDYIAVTAACYSGVALASVDQSTGTANTNQGLTCQPGSITPTQNNELIITGVANNNSNWTPTLNQSFILRAQSANAVNNAAVDSFMGELIQGTAAAVNPTFTFTGANDSCMAVIASFKPLLAAGAVRQTGVTIRGGKVAINGGYVAIGPPPKTIAAAPPAGMTGQCQGLLCSITYPN